MSEHLDGASAGIDVWSTVAWRELAVSWLDEQLAAAAIKRTGEVQQPHLRPWATVLTAPTTNGPIWFKAGAASTSFEVAVYELLNQIVPERVLAPIATDISRGWIVLPDGGPPLADRVTGLELVTAFESILPRYGQLQRDLAPHVDGLLAIGVSDMRAAIMPRRFDEAVEAVSGFVEQHGTVADQAAHRRAAALRETFASWCDQLAAVAGPASLDHNDLHPWNMLVPTVDRPEQVRFYDWGDSVVAHSFASMLVPLGWLQRQLAVQIDSPELLRVRDAYLEVFGDLAPHAELVEALELACHVGKAARALTWDRALSSLDSAEAGRHASAPLQCIHALLDDSYLGGA